MLRTLTNYPVNVAEGLLADMILDMWPNAGENQTIHDQEKDFREKVIKETINKLKLSHEDKSAEAIGQIYGFLTKEMGKLIFPQSNKKEVKNRIGQKGMLRPGEYKVIFNNSFKKYYLPLGIRPSHVQSAVNYPEKLQHIFPKQFGISNTDSISLFLTFPGSHFCLLVLTVRDGATQKVCHAWRIYKDDIDFKHDQSPLDILKLFLNKYGLEFQLYNENDKRKFIFYEKLPLQSKHSIENVLRNFRSNKFIIANFFHQVNEEDDSIEIALCFVLDMATYGKNIKKYLPFK